MMHMVKEDVRMPFFFSTGTVYIVCGSFNPGRIQLLIEEKTLENIFKSVFFKSS